MSKQDIMVNIDTTSVENIDTIQKCLDMLGELLDVQGKVMDFLDKEGLEDSLEGEAIADGMGCIIRAFDGILPQDIYDKIVSGEVA